MVVKPGYKTTELIASVLAALASWLAAWQDTLEPRYAAMVTGFVAGLYAVSRAITKHGVATGAAKIVPAVVAETPPLPLSTPVTPPQAV